MLLLLGALVAGVLTSLAPCVLPLLPVIVGGSVATPADTSADAGGGVAVATRRRVSAGTTRALVVTASLGVSVILFTLLLKATTALIGIPAEVWNVVAGGLLILLGVFSLFPSLWDQLSARLGLESRSVSRLASARGRDGIGGAVLTGAALGPVFSSCSPMYGYLVVTVLPAQPAYGFALLLTYTFGMCVALLVVALAGQRVVRRLGWVADARSTLRRALGLVFVLVGIVVFFGWDRDLQAWVIEHSPIRPWEADQGFIPGSS